MEYDDDFLPPTQFSTQYRGNQQAVTSTSLARDMPGPSRSSGHSSRPSQASQELSQIKEGLKFLMDRVHQFSGDSRGIKRPAEQKPYDKKPDTKEQCQLCKKYYANKTTLFRHYLAMHQEMNPEKYHGCSVNSTVVSLDDSFRENTCGICGYVAASQNALDAHNKDVHSNVYVNSYNDNTNIKNAHGIASTSSSGVNRTDVVAGAANKENVSSNNNVIDTLHKCEECACYFVEHNKLDEHMKVQHGFEVVCKICNKNLLFKDIDGHVKDNHPDVYTKNTEESEKVIIKKVMKNKKGNRVHVFICTKCDIKMFDKVEAENHARGHKKGLKIKVTPRNKVCKAKKNISEVTPNNAHIILTCEDCDISTGSYDAAVEHAQNHITNPSNNIQFVTQLCLICKLKFETLCYRKHIDLHYKIKEIHKESFKYFKYRFRVLLSDNWFNCFNTDKPAFEYMISRSIYEHTRSVKMRVMHEGTYILYKCCQCDNFVEPTAVLNHTMNYDTCVKVKCSHACHICQRKFNNRLARNNHVKDHKSEETYKTVFFNHENDKEFNEILNDPSIRLDNGELQNSGEVINNDANASKVLYKCLCGLCFVRRENADVHTRICPGKDPKKWCPKCNHLFNPEELLAHCFEHHLNETPVVIENISPDAIVILDSDEEDDNHDIIEIDPSEDDVQTERFDNINIELLNTDDATIVLGSSEYKAERQTMHASQIAVSENGASEANLIIEKFEKENIDEDGSNNDLGIDNEMTDDESEDTISYENIETVVDVENPASNMKHDKLKCIPVNLLLNPLHFENVILNSQDIGVVNARITADIDTVRHQIETTANIISSGPFNDTVIKQEKSSLFDPTDFSYIRSRRSLRQIEIQPASSNLIPETVDLLLTDDEETEMNHDTEINDNIRCNENNDILNEETENNDMHEEPSNTSNASITEQEQHEVVDTAVEMSNDMPHTTNNEDITTIMQNEINYIEESVGGNNGDCETAHTEFTDINDQGVNANVSNLNHSSYEDAESDENATQGNSDDDDNLFVPSGIENRKKTHKPGLNTNEKEIPIDNPLNFEERIVAHSANNKTHASGIEESESTRFENIPVDNTTKSVENRQDDTEINGNIRSHEHDDVLSTDGNETEIDRENYASTERVLSNHGENTQDFVESTLKEASTNISDPEVTLREEICKKEGTYNNVKKELDYLNIKIKRELIEESAMETEKGCDKEIVVKTEPKDAGQYNGNEENDVFVLINANDDEPKDAGQYKENEENDVIVLSNANDDIYKSCSIC